jgi:NTE family protein
MRRIRSRLGVAALALLAAGCWAWSPPNRPIDHIDLTRGYRTEPGTWRHRAPGDVWLMVALSGGGTRAAALAYGVLEELRDTEIVVGGKPVRLIDEIDVLSGVSGGSFPAAYYSLYGDRIFEDFEERFLKKNVQRALVWRTLAPWNLLRLWTPLLNRSDIASGYYDKHIFEGATFADLTAANGPRTFINATALPEGVRFTFSQGAFDVICSDLDAFPISYAVAASSAVPVLLSPVTLRNYGGRCGFEIPEWFEEALAARTSNPRAYRYAKEIQPFLDPRETRYIHLVDGGISDNLGLRASLDRLAILGTDPEQLQTPGVKMPEHLVVIVVNAETEPDPTISLQRAAPGVAASLNLVSGSQIRRYNFETLLLTQEAVKGIVNSLSRVYPHYTGNFIEVSFDLLRDEDEQKYFKRLPTSFTLSDTQVERLEEAGHTILRNNPSFKAMLRAVSDPEE